MKKLYGKVLDIKEESIDLVIQEHKRIKETVDEMIKELSPELEAICKKIGIKDKANFKKSICRKMIDNIDSDSKVVADMNSDKEVVERKKRQAAKLEEGKKYLTL